MDPNNRGVTTTCWQLTGNNMEYRMGLQGEVRHCSSDGGNVGQQGLSDSKILVVMRTLIIRLLGSPEDCVASWDA